MIKNALFFFFLIQLNHVVLNAQLDERHQSTSDTLKTFTIDIPSNWSIYDQNKRISGRPSHMGMLIFSERPLRKSIDSIALPGILAQVDRGDLPSFIVDRIPIAKGMSCDKFTKSHAYNLGVELTKDPIFGTMRKLMSATPIKHNRIEIGGCQGFHYHATNKKDDWVMDVRAVAQGDVLYLFMLRNKRENYNRNLEVFDKAIASVVWKEKK